MALLITDGAPTLCLRRQAYEASGLTRAAIDKRLELTDEEFRVEGDLVVIGPIYSDAGLTALFEDLEAAGLKHYDDYFELSGNWPEWLQLLAKSR